jgi:hypothetical protein
LIGNDIKCWPNVTKTNIIRKKLSLQQIGIGLNDIGENCNYKNGIKISLVKMPLKQMPSKQMSLQQMSFEQMSLEQMSLEQMSLEQMPLEQMCC